MDYDPLNNRRWPALTVRQPHAVALVAALKRYENRTWSTDYRGPLWIHAAGTPARNAPCLQAMLPQPLGCVIGVVMLTEIVDRRPSDPLEFDSLKGPLFWRVRPAHMLDSPVACDGALRLWRLPPRILSRCLRQLPS